MFEMNPETVSKGARLTLKYGAVCSQVDFYMGLTFASRDTLSSKVW